ncbi:MAG: fumarylacetoacetate hydrolase family protein [Eubacteriales bacterium]|nr:fumarylacetoacetate hydrolase family protein [Eubacteriales bacterium]
MRYATFNYNGKEQLGVLTGDMKSVVSLDAAFQGLTMTELISRYDAGLASSIKRIQIGESNKLNLTLQLTDVILDSPIPNPPRGVICIGKNYREHIREVAKAIDSEKNIPSSPIYFSKLIDRCPGPDSIIPYEKSLPISLDYEAELAVIIGKEGKNISKEEAYDYVFGYTILNDISERISQRKHTQWFRGKSFDGSCPMGPWIVTADEFDTPIELDVKSFVNGELRQNSNTREFIFDIPYLISDFSKGITLKPGDIIATGTPAGVGMGFEPPKYLNPGDSVECVIENIGSLKNTIL